MSRRISWSVSMGLVGCHASGEIEVEDDATDQQIEEEVRQEVFTSWSGAGPMRSVERKFIAEVAGLSAEVLRPQALALEGVGIGTSAILCDRTGEPLFGVTIRHADGTVLTALLGEDKLDRLANMMADFVEALEAVKAEARH